MRRILITLSILALFALVACGIVPAPSATPPPSATPTLTPAAPVIAPSPTPDANAVRLWFPSAFAPSAAQAGGAVLAEQLAAFQTAHPQLRVEWRAKDNAGPGGLLPALIAAYNAAPAALPNLAVLSHDEAVAAHRAGLLAPFDDLITPETLANYYPFAQSMSRVDNAFVCLPFVADARLMAYNTQIYPSPPLAWADIITGPLILPAAETSGLSLLSTYLSLGGALTLPSGQALLETEVLADALTFYQTAHENGFLPLSALTYTDAEAVWQVFRERRAALAFTSARWYLAEYDRLSAASAAPLPTRDGSAYALAEGWCWALINTAPEQRPATAGILQWLIAPEQLSAWALAANLLPPRADAVQGWASVSRARFADNLLRHAQLQPSVAVLARVGLPLRQALEDVLNGRVTPTVAANTAAQAVAAP